MNCSWYKTSISIILSTASHCKCFTWTSLTVAQTSSWKTFQSSCYDVFCTNIEYNFLRSILQYFFKSKTPILLLVINKSMSFILWNIYINITRLFVNLQVFSSKIYCRTWTNYYFNSTVVISHYKTFSLMKLFLNIN